MIVQEITEQYLSDNHKKVEFMVQAFYDYLEKHNLPSVTLGEDEDIILLDQTPAVQNSPQHLEWFNNFYTLWGSI